MTAERVLAQSDTIFGAPDAIPRLRRFILDLAVRGKLVGQDSNDEPASELLKRIAAEKVRMVTAGTIRPPRNLGGDEDLPTPFEIPTCWHWVRLDRVGAIVGGGTPSASDPENFADPGIGAPWLTPADLGGFSAWFISRGARDLSENGLKTSSATLVPAGTVLFTSRAPIGYVAISANPVSTNQGFKSIVPYVPDCSRFIALAMKAFAPEIDANAPGTTFKEVSGKFVAGVLFPLPPLAEQHRIVAKVDEMMALCDRLEAVRTERQTTQNRLTAASLARLNAPDPDPATFWNHAAFALENLTPLTTHPDQIKAFRQTILNLAVLGKLTHQDPAEDRGNQQQLRAATEVGSFDPREFEDRAMHFGAPVNWIIEPLSRVASHVVDCPHSTPKWTNEGVLCIKTNQVKAGYLDLSSPYFVSEDTYRVRIKRLEPKQCDVLYIREGGILGISCLVPPNTSLCLGQRLMLIRATNALMPRFLELCLNSSWIKDFAAEKTTGGAAPRVNMSTIRGYPIPVPPLAEQHRIVAKVDELLVLCNRLENNLASNADMRCRLLDVVLRDTLAHGTEPKAPQDDSAMPVVQDRECEFV